MLGIKFFILTKGQYIMPLSYQSQKEFAKQIDCLQCYRLNSLIGQLNLPKTLNETNRMFNNSPTENHVVGICLRFPLLLFKMSIIGSLEVSKQS